VSDSDLRQVQCPVDRLCAKRQYRAASLAVTSSTVAELDDDLVTRWVRIADQGERIRPAGRRRHQDVIGRSDRSERRL
jgi:hypothetical protein